jgi:hypothetical protein
LSYLRRLKIQVYPYAPICNENCIPIIFSGGKGVDKDHYSIYARELASWGYVIYVLEEGHSLDEILEEIKVAGTFKKEN